MQQVKISVNLRFTEKDQQNADRIDCEICAGMDKPACFQARKADADPLQESACTPEQQNAQQATQPQQQAPAQPAGDSWVCACGATATGKFCSECGAPKPAPAQWTCDCGTVNTGKFCTECGKSLSESKTCPHCGAHMTEGDLFCQNCGKRPQDENAVNEAINNVAKCPHCGSTISGGDAFCQNCGKILNDEIPVAQPSEQILRNQAV